MPYTESGVSMLVLSKNNDKLSMWIFLQPLTNDLWIATTVFIFFTGLVLWMSEFPSNDEFRGSRLRQFSTVFYFIFSTLTFSRGMWSQPSFFFIAFINQKVQNCMHLYDSELELNNMIYLLSAWFDFSNNIHLFMLLTDQIIRRLPSKVLAVIWCFVVLTLVANCEEAPTFSDWSESTLAQRRLCRIPEWIICAREA